MNLFARWEVLSVVCRWRNSESGKINEGPGRVGTVLGEESSVFELTQSGSRDRKYTFALGVWEAMIPRRMRGTQRVLKKARDNLGVT